MIKIPFVKLHGSENDFLLTWADEVQNGELPEIARRICARRSGIGADGWMIVSRENGSLHTRLFNSDGSEPELSGNGTRCAAAFGLMNDAVSPGCITITTGAGKKELRLITNCGTHFVFEMNMGWPKTEELRTNIRLAGADFDATVLNVGNPQCAIFVQDFPENWRSAARECEKHPRFPKRTNVSFVRLVDRHAIDVLFFERGAGETKSSGTGSTGAACAAILRGIAESPVEIRTPAGTMELRWDDNVYLTGPAEIIGEGVFSLDY
jgi:diaminopimelate epimerase